MEHIPHFSALPYQRPDYEAAKAKLDELTAQVKNADSYTELRQVIDEKNTYFARINLQGELAFIRCYLDSSDPFYAQEMQFNTQQSVLLDDSIFSLALLDSPFAAELDREFGPLYLQRHRDHVRLTANGHELMASEQALMNRIQQMKATRKIEFDGKQLSEGELTAYLTGTDRDTRRQAMLAQHKALAGQKEELDDLLEQLVQTRVALAKANGFDSYLDYINLEKGRRSYGQRELLAFCQHVKTHLVPLATQLYQRQARQLGLNHLACYDIPLVFPDGNAKPIGDGAKLLEAAKEMYDAISPDIALLFRTMADKGYIDILSSPNKISGMGFCTSIHALNMPYVFGNCEGDINDATVLTHEIGHAYQMWRCMHRHIMPEFCDMPNDVVEVPSKAMELFTMDHAELFFGDDAEKFRFSQYRYVVREICAFCSTCEYEDWLYSHPEATAQERIDKELEIYAIYNPGIDRSELQDYLTLGSSLYSDFAVYMFPGYVISYALSDMGALEFRLRAEEDFAAAWQDYKALCSAGGSMDYDDLMATAHLGRAYEEGSVARAADFLKQVLDQYKY